MNIRFQNLLLIEETVAGPLEVKIDESSSLG
jgi:hypothetical protein